MPSMETTGRLIKEEANRLGFLFCGFSKADYLEKEAPRLEKWLHQKAHGEMAYMANNFDKRLDPRILVEDAESVISLAYNYFPEKEQSDPLAPKIARYAYGEDYHHVVKDKIYLLMSFIKELVGDISGRVFIDSAPVLEKAWAAKSGLGWVGKNTNLINQSIGSYFFLGEIISDLKLLPDLQVLDHCGTCTRCIDACPTEALSESYILDASKCISYLTIELKKEIPEPFLDKMENWAFGCDICQEVCPWNRFSKPHTDSLLAPNLTVLEMSKKDWQEITYEVFDRLFEKSPLQRAGFSKIQASIRSIFHD